MFADFFVLSLDLIAFAHTLIAFAHTLIALGNTLIALTRLNSTKNMHRLLFELNLLMMIIDYFFCDEITKNVRTVKIVSQKFLNLYNSFTTK